jgi:hypothetical protein
MCPTVEVKSADKDVRKQREALADRVIEYFGDRLPHASLLCFFDDEDWPALKVEQGAANRGGYLDIGRTTPAEWFDAPQYLSECVLEKGQPRFDHLIYLHGTTCSCEMGLTWTFAHELQHFVQQIASPKQCAAGRLIRRLPPDVIDHLGLGWCDIPHEREARIVSKRVCEALFGVESVRQFIEAQINQSAGEEHIADWVCIRGLDASRPYDLVAETRQFFLRHTQSRSRFEEVLERLQTEDPDKSLDLDAL